MCHLPPLLSAFLTFIFLSDLPQTEIRLGGSLNGSNIREFDDVYFECRLVNICCSPPICPAFCPDNLTKIMTVGAH